MNIGVDYYPEHWSRTRWEEDARHMAEAGFNTVRIGEFSWQKIEPSEGKFDFRWLKEAIGVLSAHGLKVIVGTPTAVLPAWAAKAYPDVMAMEASGKRLTYGVRKNNCFTSENYKRLSMTVCEEMSSQLGNLDALIGWQTDNEFGGPNCFCPSCQDSFRDYLKDKYGTLEEVNRKWGLHFWGHSIGDWTEIVIPDNEDTFNPSQILDYRRFHSFLNEDFQRKQIEIIKKNSPGRFVTHNLMGLYPDLDYFNLAEDLDFVSWDNYPNMGNIGAFEVLDKEPYGIEMNARIRPSLAADLMRGLKKRNFWIMEQTAGPIGWGIFSKNTWPGELRNISYQQMAHGCDGQIWFRWRTCTAGREQYWHGLLGHDGVAGRRYNEAKQFAHEALGPLSDVYESQVNSRVAIIYDYDSQWALSAQPGYEGCDYQKSILRYYSALYRRGVNVDIISKKTDFSSYKILLAPHLHVLDGDTADRIDSFIRSGGHFLADCRTGVKDESNLCYELTLPGLLSDSLGIKIDEYESLENRFEYEISLSELLGGPYSGKLYADWIIPEGAESLMTYETLHVKDYSVATRNKRGKGRAYYVGTIVEETVFYDKLMELIFHDADLECPPILPEGIQVRSRNNGDREFVFVINHKNEKISTKLPCGVDLFTGQEYAEKGEVAKMNPFEVRIIERNNR